MIIGHAVGKSAAPMPGNIPRAKKAFARARRTRRSTTGAAARPAVLLRSSTLASRVRSRSFWASVVSFMPVLVLPAHSDAVRGMGGSGKPTNLAAAIRPQDDFRGSSLERLSAGWIAKTRRI
jgi:hypothetical protein